MFYLSYNTLQISILFLFYYPSLNFTIIKINLVHGEQLKESGTRKNQIKSMFTPVEPGGPSHGEGLAVT